MSQLDLEKIYKQQKIEEEYINAVNYLSQVQKEAFIKYLTNINEQYLLEYRTAQQRKAQKKRRQWSEPSEKIPPELIQAYLRIDQTSRVSNTYIQGWGAHKSDRKSDSSTDQSLMYSPKRDFQNKDLRRRTNKRDYVWVDNNTAYPTDDLERTPQDSDLSSITPYNHTNSFLQSFTMEIDYGKCHYKKLSKDQAISYLGLTLEDTKTGVLDATGNITVTGTGCAWLTAYSGGPEGLPSNAGRTAWKASANNQLGTNLSSLRFLFKNEDGQYDVLMYDDKALMTGGNRGTKYNPLFAPNIPERCFNQGNLHIGFFKDSDHKNNSGQPTTTNYTKYMDQGPSGIYLLIQLADQIWKTDEFQHRLINHEAAPTSDIIHQLNFRYIGQSDPTRVSIHKIPSFDALINVITKKNTGNTDTNIGYTLSLSPLYSDYIYLTTVANKLNEAEGFKDVQNWGELEADVIKQYMLNEANNSIFIQAADDNYNDRLNNRAFSNNITIVKDALKILNIYRNATTLDQFIKGEIDATDFTFIKEIANIYKDAYKASYGLARYFTEKLYNELRAWDPEQNGSSYPHSITNLSREVTEKIYGDLIDIYFPPEQDKFRRINELYKRNIFNNLIITKHRDRDEQEYITPAFNNNEDPNFIPNFQNFKPLNNYLSNLSNIKDLVYDLILDTGNHNPDKHFSDQSLYKTPIISQLYHAWQLAVDAKKVMLQAKKAYDRVLKNKDDYTGDDAESDYQDDLQNAKEAYNKALNDYRKALSAKKAIIQQYCVKIDQTTLDAEKGIVAYFAVLQDKLEQVKALKDRITKLQGFSTDEIWTDYKEHNSTLKNIDKKIEELTKSLQKQETILLEIESKQNEVKNRITQIQQQLANATAELAKYVEDEAAAKKLQAELNKSLAELQQASTPDKTTAVAKYYEEREQAEQLCIDLGEEIDKLRKSDMLRKNPDEVELPNKGGKKLETNPKILEALGLIDETVDAVGKALVADPNDQAIIASLETDPDVEAIMNPSEGEGESDSSDSDKK